MNKVISFSHKFSKKGKLPYFIIEKLAKPAFHLFTNIKQVLKNLLRSIFLLGILKTVKIYFRHIYCVISNPNLNRRIKKEIGRVGNIDTLKDGSATKKGFLYHDIPLPDNNKIKVHRENTFLRLRKIKQNINFKGHRVLDIGCANGSISLGLSMMGALKVYGIDYDKQAIRVAESLKDKYKLYNLQFKHLEIHPDRLDLPEVDTLVWLSNWMWLVKAYGMEKGLDLLYDVPYNCNAETMVFESAADDGMAPIIGKTQEDIEQFLRDHTPFSEIKNIGPFPDKWRTTKLERHVFICSNRKTFYRSKNAVVERVKRNVIRKTFSKENIWAMNNELNCLKRLEGYDYFPNVIEVGDNWYDMEYCGKKIESINDSKALLNIVKILDENNIVHRDINEGNLLCKDGNLFLIDFEWAVVDGIEPRSFIPDGLGRGYYDKDKYCDSVAANRLIEKIMK